MSHNQTTEQVAKRIQVPRPLSGFTSHTAIAWLIPRHKSLGTSLVLLQDSQDKSGNGLGRLREIPLQHTVEPLYNGHLWGPTFCP